MKPKSKITAKKKLKGKGGPFKGITLKKLKREQDEDVVVINSDDEAESARPNARRFKSVKELTAKAIVDEVTRNLKRKALTPLMPPAKMLPKQITEDSRHTLDMRTPMEYFMFQYKILQSCGLPGEGTDPTEGLPKLSDSYGFLTFITKRFLVCSSKLIQQIDKDFDIDKWMRSFVGTEIKSHPVPVTESKATARYFESVFGKLPGSDLDDNDKPLYASNMATNNPDSNKASNLIETEATKPFKEDFAEKANDFDDNCNEDFSEDVYDQAEVANVIDNKIVRPVSTTKIDIANTPVGALEQVQPKNAADFATNINKLLCTYCNHGGFDFMGRYISHMMLEHFSKKVIEFICEKCNQNAVISSRSSLASCINHAKGKCLEMKNEKSKNHFNDEGLTYLRCGFCGFKTEAKYRKDMINLDMDIMVDHYIDTHNAEYFCNTCEKYFNSIEIFECHQEICPPRPNQENEKTELHYYMQNKCGVHNVTFNSEYDYADHSLQFHLLDISGGEICRVLNLDLPFLTAKRDKKLGLKFPCNICGRDKVKFETAKEWATHAGEMHANAGSQCPICCKFLGCIKQHNRNTHSILDEHYFPCNVEGCRYKASLFENVTCHLRYFHKMESLPEKMEFKKCCAADDCNFIVAIEYVNGALTKDYKKRTRELCSHHERVHQKKLCDKCGRYVAKSYYDRHLESHLAEETGEKKYNCDICNKLFTHQKSMIDHKRRHDVKNKTHICEQCGKSFYTGSDLCTHVKVSHATDAEKVFFCDKCNKGFSRRGLLRAHLKQSCGAGDMEGLIPGVQKPKRPSPFKRDRKVEQIQLENPAAAVASITTYVSQQNPLETAASTTLHQFSTGNPHESKEYFYPTQQAVTQPQERPASMSPHINEEIDSGQGTATDLRLPMIHTLESYDTHQHNLLQQRGVETTYAHNIMNSFGRVPFANTAAAAAVHHHTAMDGQAPTNVAAFLSQFHY